MCRGIFPTSEPSETSETSKMSVNIQWTPRHVPFAKSLSFTKSSVDELIDLQGLFNDYWSSGERQFTVRGQS